MAASKSSRATSAAAAADGRLQRGGEGLLLGQLQQRGIIGAGERVPLLLLCLEDVGGAAIAGEEVLAVVGIEEGAQGLDAAHDHQQIVLAGQGEHGVDEVMAGALVAQVDFEAVGEEGEEVATQLLRILKLSWLRPSSKCAFKLHKF